MNTPVFRAIRRTWVLRRAFKFHPASYKIDNSLPSVSWSSTSIGTPEQQYYQFIQRPELPLAPSYFLNMALVMTHFQGQVSLE